MQAYRIANWWRYELLKNGKLATVKTKMVSLRIKPLIYVRFDVNADKNHNHILSADYRRMAERSGPELAAACDGLYKMLVGLAGNQVRKYRGWVLDDWQRPMDPGQLAKFLCLSERKVRQIFEILTDPEVNFVEFLDFPESLRKSLNRSDLSGDSQIKKSGNNQEKKGSPLYETETEAVSSKDKGFVTETEEGGFGKNRDREGAGQEEIVQPLAQPPPQASASVSGTGTGPVPVSDSEKTSVSDSAAVPDSVSDSASRPGAAAVPRADGPGHLDKQKIFEIMRERCHAELKAVQILKLNPRNKSDSTTISDIYSQLAQLLIGGSPYTLFESSLATARQCWRGDKPVAMFVAAMKKPPFYYVPKKLSVIPGKFSQGKNTNRNFQERSHKNE